jgi:hypothetical protein
MIEVRVRDEHEIDIRELCRRHGALHQTQRAERPEQQIDPDTRIQCRIGQDANAEEVDEDRGMAEPRQRYGVVGPRGGRWLVRRRWHLATDLRGAIHQEIEAPRTDGQGTETASDAGGDKRSTIPETAFH